MPSMYVLESPGISKFTDKAAAITIKLDAKTSTGYTVTLTSGPFLTIDDVTAPEAIEERERPGIKLPGYATFTVRLSRPTGA